MYKRIVRMLARAFYTRNVPEKDPNAPEPRTDTQRRKAKEVRCTGLCAIIVHMNATVRAPYNHAIVLHSVCRANACWRSAKAVVAPLVYIDRRHTCRLHGRPCQKLAMLHSLNPPLLGTDTAG